MNSLNRGLRKNSGLVMAVERDHARIEAFQVPNLKNAPVRGGSVDQRPRGCEIVSNGLFHHDVETHCQQRASDFGMRHGGRRDDRGIGVFARVLHRVKYPVTLAFSHFRRTLLVGFDHAGELGVFRFVNIRR